MLSAQEVRQRLRQACKDAGSQSAFAKAARISQAYVNDTLRGRREPGDAILKALGLRRIIGYDERN